MSELKYASVSHTNTCIATNLLSPTLFHTLTYIHIRILSLFRLLSFSVLSLPSSLCVCVCEPHEPFIHEPFIFSMCTFNLHFYRLAFSNFTHSLTCAYIQIVSSLSSSFSLFFASLLCISLSLSHRVSPYLYLSELVPIYGVTHSNRFQEIQNRDTKQINKTDGTQNFQIYKNRYTKQIHKADNTKQILYSMIYKTDTQNRYNRL